MRPTACASAPSRPLRRPARGERGRGSGRRGPGVGGQGRRACGMEPPRGRSPGGRTCACRPGWRCLPFRRAARPGPSFRLQPRLPGAAGRPAPCLEPQGPFSDQAGRATVVAPSPRAGPCAVHGVGPPSNVHLAGGETGAPSLSGWPKVTCQELEFEPPRPSARAPALTA